MTEVLLLGRRAVREIIRYPEATIPTLFIPLFFLAVNIGQVQTTFNAQTAPWLNGQSYVAFQLPVSLMFAVATATTAQKGQAGSSIATRAAEAAMPMASSASSVAGRTKREASQPQKMRAGTAAATAMAKTSPARSRS